MGFLIRNIKTRDGEGIVNIRGCDDGCVEFVRISMTAEIVDKEKTGNEVELILPYKFYNSIESALDKLFRMRVCNRDATTLQELMQNVKEERELLTTEFSSQLLTRKRR
jgi:hypothetical protein